MKSICRQNTTFFYRTVLTMAKDGDSDFLLPLGDKYYVVDSRYPNKQGFLAPYRSSQNGLLGITCRAGHEYSLLTLYPLLDPYSPRFFKYSSLPSHNKSLSFATCKYKASNKYHKKSYDSP